MPGALLCRFLIPPGVGHYLDAAKINVYGHIEGGYTTTSRIPAKDLNLGRVFDINNNRPQINQTRPRTSSGLSI